MALVVFDPCSVGIMGTEEGLAFQFSEIEGFDGIKVIVPLGKDAAEGIYNEVGKALGHAPVSKVPVATVTDLHKEVRRHGGTPGQTA